MLRHSVFMPRQSLVKTKSFDVAKKKILCCDRISQGEDNLCCDRVFLHCDRVWPRQKILGRERVFSYHDRVWGKGQGSLCRDREFDVVRELSKLVS